MLVLLSRARLPACLAGLCVVAMTAVLLASPSTAAPVAAAPAADDDVTDPFLGRLLDEINRRRDAVGTQHLAFIPASANSALDGFLSQTMPAMAWPRPCQHHLVGGAFSWDYVLETGFDGEARGEVLACPGPQPYWTPGRTAEQWWDSPHHFSVLYADPDANGLVCSANGIRNSVISSTTTIISVRGRKGSPPAPPVTTLSADAAAAVLCVTFRD